MPEIKYKRCEICKFRSQYTVYADSDNIGEFYDCNHPEMDPDKNKMIKAGGEDGYGDYFYVNESFGCILWEKRDLTGDET